MHWMWLCWSVRSGVNINIICVPTVQHRTRGDSTFELIFLNLFVSEEFRRFFFFFFCLVRALPRTKTPQRCRQSHSACPPCQKRGSVPTVQHFTSSRSLLRLTIFVWFQTTRTSYHFFFFFFFFVWQAVLFRQQKRPSVGVILILHVHLAGSGGLEHFGIKQLARPHET